MEINDTLISYGGAIKAVEETDDTVKLRGMLVEFGSPDNHDSSALRDYFDKDTDFRIPAEGAKSAVYYHHGLNPTLKTRQLATADIGIDESGVWFEAELNKRDKYEAKIAQMARMGKLGLSSGTASHLVRRTPVVNAQGMKANHIDLWPLGLDASLTPTPAQPTLTVMALKSIDVDEDAFVDAESTLEAPEVIETKNLTDLTDSLHDGLSFEDHSMKVLAAVEEIAERITSLKEMRCIKSERRWSADKFAQLNALSDGLKASADAIKAQAEEYAPRDVAAEQEQRNKAALQAVAEYQLTLARLNGVSI